MSDIETTVIKEVCSEESRAPCSYPLCHCRTIPKLTRAVAKHLKPKLTRPVAKHLKPKPLAPDAFA